MMVSQARAASVAGAGTPAVYARRRDDKGSELVMYDRNLRAGRVVWSAADEGEAEATIEDIAVSADGRVIAFVVAAGESGEGGLTINPYADLHLYDEVSGRCARFGAAGELDPILSTVPMIREVALSADGERIAFVAEKARGFPGQADVFVYDLRAGLLSQVNPAPLSPCRNVAISGDGGAVFFTDAATGRLHVHDLASATTRALPITVPQGSAAHYSVSEDGRFISFTSAAFGEQGEIRLFDRRSGAIEDEAGRAPRPLPRRPLAAPSWSSAARATIVSSRAAPTEQAHAFV
ncbi:TolB family protein [Sphingomonas parva]|nr:PD40 domain-containing protein [Sphingomonas parva]